MFGRWVVFVGARVTKIAAPALCSSDPGLGYLWAYLFFCV